MVIYNQGYHLIQFVKEQVENSEGSMSWREHPSKFPLRSDGAIIRDIAKQSKSNISDSRGLSYVKCDPEPDNTSVDHNSTEQQQMTERVWIVWNGGLSLSHTAFAFLLSFC